MSLSKKSNLWKFTAKLQNGEKCIKCTKLRKMNQIKNNVQNVQNMLTKITKIVKIDSTVTFLQNFPMPSKIITTNLQTCNEILYA
jgi:hypothetical protein